MISSETSRSTAGFTLVELLLVLVIVGIVATVTVTQVSISDESARYETTRAHMSALRVALLGDDARNAEGRRVNFGYVGDWGSLPGALTNLTTAQVPAYAFSNVYGVGAGWRGPYVPQSFSTLAPNLDAFGTAYVWTPAGAPPTLTSRGADLVAGGVGLATDLSATFPTTDWRATVTGVVSDRGTPLNARTVEIRYPVAGTLTAFTNATTATGQFTFNNVPYGVRSLRVTTAPTLGPVQIVVDQPTVQVPAEMLDYSGNAQKVTYVAASRVNACSGVGTVCVTLNSTYTAVKTLEYVTARWSQDPPLYMGQFFLGGGGALMTGLACLPSGHRLDTPAGVGGANATINPGAGNTWRMHMYGTSPACGAAVALNAATVFQVTFEWVGTLTKDTISF